MSVKEKLRLRLAVISSYVEIALGTLLLIAIILCAIQMVPSLFKGLNFESFHDYLEGVFTLIIGVEALKMIYKHSPGSAIEVLLYTIAREMVVNHTSALENLLAIISIAILFVIRKYLFVDSFGSHHVHLDPSAEDESLDLAEHDAKELAEVRYAEREHLSIH